MSLFVSMSHAESRNSVLVDKRSQTTQSKGGQCCDDRSEWLNLTGVLAVRNDVIHCKSDFAQRERE